MNPIPHFSSFLITDNIPFDNICDSSASCCAFHSSFYFTTLITRPTINSSLGGIAHSLPIHGIGMSTITLQTHANKFLTLHIPNSLYVPNLPCNLILPQWLIQTLQKQKNHHYMFLPMAVYFIKSHIVPLPYHPTSNLPVFQLQNSSPDPSPMTDSNNHRLSSSTSHFATIDQSSSTTSAFCTMPDEYSNMTSTQ